jgi:hypothetical protein
MKFKEWWKWYRHANLIYEPYLDWKESTAQAAYEQGRLSVLAAIPQEVLANYLNQSSSL